MVDGFDHRKVSANLLSLNGDWPELYQFIAHRNSAKCRSYEFKWCFYINRPDFQGFLRTKKVILVSTLAPPTHPLTVASDLLNNQKIAACGSSYQSRSSAALGRHDTKKSQT
ncbi:hypothetical protein [Pseudomonas endophytica]|uniref:hypothetical protein n=1 Tax=Pseudomonas endophytica TaxID=1563157 RepID=UPI0012E1418A|nr:hypothetical protein [Pseudomonas endophytica]